MNRIAIILIVFVTGLLLSSCENTEAEHWKKRWKDDTAVMANDLRDLAKKYATLDAENKALKEKIAELEKQLNEMREKK